MSFQSDWDAFLHREMTEIIRKNCQVSEKTASDTAENVAETLRKNFAGCAVHFPLSNIRRRNRQILEEFNGRNMRELMKKYDVKRSQFYNIIKKIHSHH